MKAFKSVFAAFAALFLAVSLSGCLGDEKTASQSGEVESSIFDSGKVKLVLKPGARFVYMHFATRNAAEQQRESIRQAFLKQEITADTLRVSGDDGEVLLFIEIKPVAREVVAHLDSTDLMDIDIQSSNGRVAYWDPSTGNEVNYI